MKTKSKHILLFFALGMLALPIFCQQNPKAYAIFDAQGNEVSFDRMIQTLSKKRVVFFGEMHNCPIAHWLEYETTKQLYAIHDKRFAMGAEMFEADNQRILDEFMQSLISERNYESEMRLWNNYSTDYAQLIDFAKEHAIPFTATNVPRRYAQLVSRKGLDALHQLSDEAKRDIAPLPIPYQTDSTKNEMFRSMTAMMGHSKKNPEFMTQAQAIKDATMAWNIAQNLKENVACFLHFNGTFHSDNHDGIIPFLKTYRKDVTVGTISSCRQEDISRLEDVSVGRADFIICIPQDMVHSY